MNTTSIHCLEFAFVIAFSIFLTVVGDFNPYMDNDLFMINWASPHDLDNLAAVDENVIIMKTANDEKYRCILPDLRSDGDRGAKDHHSAVSPHELIHSLFTQTSCSYRIESYWTYELCHGKHLRQYHESKELGLKNPKVQEYYLGKSKHSEEAKAKGDDVVFDEIPFTLKYRKIDNVELPYYEVNMTDGSHCELTTKSRRAHIMYICQPDGRGEVYELKETSTCEYDVIVLTSVLCAHSAFKPKDAPVNKIQCRAIEGSPLKPKQLETIEQEYQKPGQKEAHLTSLMPIKADEEEEASIEVTKPQSIRPQAQNLRTDVIGATTDKQLMRDFLSGDYCLKGGAGWWKYEFCFGKYARQYHDDQEGRNVIFLGHWDEKAHLTWMTTNPTKQPKETLKRKYISNYYSKGDVCDLTGNHRFAEIRLKCSENSNSPHAVSIYMTEPRHCEYVLVVESPILCSLMDKVDDNGLIQNVEADDSRKAFDGPLIKPTASAKNVKYRMEMKKTEFQQKQMISEKLDTELPTVSVVAAKKATVDPHLVEDFLHGHYCLKGGGSWWKYEFCLGNFVKQYHEDKNDRTDVILGYWDERTHLTWLANNPSKLPTQTLRTNYISNYYSGGDVCAITGKRRFVEVKLKCSEHYSRPMTVNILVEEKKPCEYIMTISAPLICQVFDKVDKSGIFWKTES